MRRFIVILGIAIAMLAIAAWVTSYARPLKPRLIRDKPQRSVFVASRYGKLTFWTQEISPPPPDPNVYTVRLDTPFHMRVSGQGSLFSTNFNPDWPSPDLGWNTVQDSRNTVYGPGGAVYNFTLRVRSLVIGWWIIAVIALIPLAVGGLLAFVRQRRIAQGRCPVCGYDLRASPERCPECGTPAYNPAA